MLQELSNLVVADNTGAKRAMCFRILKQRKEYAHLGDIIRVSIKEASPTGSIRKDRPRGRPARPLRPERVRARRLQAQPHRFPRVRAGAARAA